MWPEIYPADAHDAPPCPVKWTQSLGQLVLQDLALSRLRPRLAACSRCLLSSLGELPDDGPGAIYMLT